MYRYDPPEESEKGSWREIFQLSWIAMSIILPVLGGVFGVMVLVMVFFWCLSIHPALTLIPVGIAALGVLTVILVDRRNQARLEAQAAANPHSVHRG